MACISRVERFGELVFVFAPVIGSLWGCSNCDGSSPSRSQIVDDCQMKRDLCVADVRVSCTDPNYRLFSYYLLSKSCFSLGGISDEVNLGCYLHALGSSLGDRFPNFDA